MILLLFLILARAPGQISISRPHGLIVVLRPAVSRCPVCLRLLSFVFCRHVGGVIRWRCICPRGDGAINLCAPLLRAWTTLLSVRVGWEPFSVAAPFVATCPGRT